MCCVLIRCVCVSFPHNVIHSKVLSFSVYSCLHKNSITKRKCNTTAVTVAVAVAVATATRGNNNKQRSLDSTENWHTHTHKLINIRQQINGEKHSLRNVSTVRVFAHLSFGVRPYVRLFVQSSNWIKCNKTHEIANWYSCGTNNERTHTHQTQNTRRNQMNLSCSMNFRKVVVVGGGFSLSVSCISICTVWILCCECVLPSRSLLYWYNRHSLLLRLSCHRSRRRRRRHCSRCWCCCYYYYYY